MKIHKVDQQSDEWFEIKLGKFSASDAQAISAKGAGLQTLVYKKVAEIISGVREETYTNPHMDRGNEQEELARASYELQTGTNVDVVGFCELNEYAGASPDGLVGEDGAAEFKCPTNSNYVKTLHTQKIDTPYEWQMQFQMYVTDRQWVDYVVFNENFEDLIVIRVERDESKIEKIRAGIESGVSEIKDILSKIQ